jgi:thymidylate kinase
VSIVTLFVQEEISLVKAIIVEGPRGAGKSAVTRILRNRIEGSTLINLTGFKADHTYGFDKIYQYYDRSILPILENLDGDYTFIFDRHFFSEMVCSELYKSYDFGMAYVELMRRLVDSVDELEVYYLRITDPDELNRRLNSREKVKLFDSVPENVGQSLQQQKEYDKWMDIFDFNFGNLDHVSYVTIDTSNMAPEEIADIILPF